MKIRYFSVSFKLVVGIFLLIYSGFAQTDQDYEYDVIRDTVADHYYDYLTYCGNENRTIKDIKKFGD